MSVATLATDSPWGRWRCDQTVTRAAADLARPSTDSMPRPSPPQPGGRWRAAPRAMADHVSDLEALLAALDITSPAYLCGVSYDGTIEFSYALHRPGDVAGIAAIESAPMTARWMSHMTATLGNGQRKVSAMVTEGFGMASRLRAQQAAEQIAAETTLRQDALSGPVLPDESLAALRLPVLCIYGGESPLAEFAPYVEQVIPGARAVIVPGHRHSVLADATGTVGSPLMSWLGQVCADGTLDPIVNGT
jgi:pimeloyl-ACP methyl ester carboxylesterase